MRQGTKRLQKCTKDQEEDKRADFIISLTREDTTIGLPFYANHSLTSKMIGRDMVLTGMLALTQLILPFPEKMNLDIVGHFTFVIKKNLTTSCINSILSVVHRQIYRNN